MNMDSDQDSDSNSSRCLCSEENIVLEFILTVLNGRSSWLLVEEELGWKS